LKHCFLCSVLVRPTSKHIPSGPLHQRAVNILFTLKFDSSFFCSDDDFPKRDEGVIGKVSDSLSASHSDPNITRSAQGKASRQIPL
jgi:hypothetical protein